MREVLHLQVGQCGNQVGAKVSEKEFLAGSIKLEIRYCTSSYLLPFE